MFLIKLICASVLFIFFDNAMAVHKCNHKYALCIAAKCINSGGTAICACKVFDGVSYSYRGSCNTLKPQGKLVVYSTYSTKLAEQGLQMMSCPKAKVMANCMAAPCINHGDTATCFCEVQPIPTDRPQATLGGNCNPSQNCSPAFIWSMANVELLQASASQCPSN